ncbi:MAG TPA: adenosylcobalamin-dependent ribonucleoside-diphosphate reductase [Deltaproteobacteria bacterium]|nr:adenosylcobalamin-dependent ribonucleoside-diphosphate reductase [Deltaproteobacteria bacterium]
MRPELSDTAEYILRLRYLKKDAEGNVAETPEELFRRVADHVGRAETVFGADAREAGKVADEFFETLTRLEFLPNSPCLMNAGRELGQLAACFVLPVNDSLESIFEAVKDTALIHQSGGGTGFSFSRLRPKNDTVLSTSGVACGPVSFMEVFDKATDVIKQGGARRGANMGVLRVDHPDIEEFVTAKRVPSRLSCFNLSVGVTDSFMEAVLEDGLVGLVNPRNKAVTKTIRARALFDLIVQCAWATGEPGILFLDEINRANPTPDLGTIEATNPCGEQPLLPYESCTLGSINLARMCRREGNGWVVDFDRIAKTARTAVRFLDDVVEINRYPLVQIREMSRANRKIGLGVMGFAHLLVRMGIPYDSDEAVRLAGDIMRHIRLHAHEASRELAVTRGPFPNFPQSIHSRRGDPPLRNATVTTIAPTGTLSMIAGCSSGIEPIYSLYTTRIVPGGISVSSMDPLFEETAQALGILDKTLVEEVKKTGVIPPHSRIPEGLRALFKTALEIPPRRHVEIQAAFQEYTDNAVSKTVNFPRDATLEDVRDAFILAHRLRCKGITVYRDGSRPGQVLTCGLASPCP